MRDKYLSKGRAVCFWLPINCWRLPALIPAVVQGHAIGKTDQNVRGDQGKGPREGNASTGRRIDRLSMEAQSLPGQQ